MKAETSTTTDTKNDSLVDEIKKYKTEALIEFLQKEEDLDLIDDDLKVIRKHKINGRAFLKTSKEDFERYGMLGGPATVLVEFAKECKEKRKRPYSSYKTQKDLEKVLSKFGIDGAKNIPPFIPRTEKISDGDKDFQFCIEEIKRKMEIIGPANLSNEATRCIYIESILICAIFIAKRKLKEKIKITLEPQSEIVGKETTGRVDCAIKRIVKIMNSLIEELICITEGKQNQMMLGIMQNTMQLDSSYYTNMKKRKAVEAFDDDFDYLYGIVSTATEWQFTMYTPDKIYCTSNYCIELNNNILKNDTEFRQSLKRVMEVIVGLLMDKVEAGDPSVNKRARTKEYIEEE